MEQKIGTILIGDKHYDIRSLNERSAMIIQNTKKADELIKKYENEIKDLKIQIAMTNVAKGSLIDKLIEEAGKNLKEVKIKKE